MRLCEGIVIGLFVVANASIGDLPETAWLGSLADVIIANKSLESFPLKPLVYGATTPVGRTAVVFFIGELIARQIRHSVLIQEGDEISANLCFDLVIPRFPSVEISHSRDQFKPRPNLDTALLIRTYLAHLPLVCPESLYLPAAYAHAIARLIASPSDYLINRLADSKRKLDRFPSPGTPSEMINLLPLFLIGTPAGTMADFAMEVIAESLGNLFDCDREACRPKLEIEPSRDRDFPLDVNRMREKFVRFGRALAVAVLENRILPKKLNHGLLFALTFLGRHVQPTMEDLRIENPTLFLDLENACSDDSASILSNLVLPEEIHLPGQPSRNIPPKSIDEYISAVVWHEIWIKHKQAVRYISLGFGTILEPSEINIGKYFSAESLGRFLSEPRIPPPLFESISTGPGLTIDSDQFRWLLEFLSRGDASERFVRLVTRGKGLGKPIRVSGIPNERRVPLLRESPRYYDLELPMCWSRETLERMVAKFIE
jgi:hypothetical protein